MRQHYPLNSNGAEDAGQMPWTDGVPSTGAQGSYPGHAIVTDAESEILSAIDAAGLARNGSDLTQLIQAIARGVYLGQFTGSANVLAAALPNGVEVPALLRGLRFAGSTAVANTGSVTVALSGFLQSPGTLPLLRRDGRAVQAGDLPVGSDFDFRFDGAAFRLIGAAPSEIYLISQNYYLTRPPVTTVWVDPVNGNDANDGSTAQLARKSIDTVVGAMGANATLINLLGDATVSLRQNVYAPLTLNGVDANANAVTRMVTFLGTAANSPTPVGTACAGWFCYQPTFRSNNIAYTIPVVPNGLSYRNHITSLGGLAAAFLTTTITLADNTNSGALLGAAIARLTATFTQLTMGVGGHLFDGIAGGANPNGDYRYTSNVTSA